MIRRRLLPVGTEVMVTPEEVRNRPPYRAIVRGYDMGRTKYHLSAWVMGWSEGFYTGEAYCWAFPDEVVRYEEGDGS